MNVGELIGHLEAFHPDAPVAAYWHDDGRLYQFADLTEPAFEEGAVVIGLGVE